MIVVYAVIWYIVGLFPNLQHCLTVYLFYTCSVILLFLDSEELYVIFAADPVGSEMGLVFKRSWRTAVDMVTGTLAE